MTAFPKATRSTSRKPEYGGDRTRAWLDWVARQGCLICDAPAELHHIKRLPSVKAAAPLRPRQGLAYLAVLPLCRKHHREHRMAIEQVGQEAFGIEHLGGGDQVLAHVLRLALRYIHQYGPRELP